MESKMDSDKHYLRSRRMLIGISLVLLIATMGGAQIYEVNTLIFKLGFKHPENLFNILLWAAGFLLIRYYNNAAKYHKEIAEEWQNRLLKDPFMYLAIPEADKETGFIVDIAPDEVPFRESFEPGPESSERVEDITLRLHWLFNASIQYNCVGVIEDDRYQRTGKIYSCQSISVYLKTLLLIVRYWWDAQFRNNESLTLYGPYLIAFVAIGCGIYTRASTLGIQL